MIPYTHHTIADEDVDAVSYALRNGHLSTGCVVAGYEAAFAAAHGYAYAVAVNSGTAALYAALRAVGIGAGDDVVTSPLTFVATANMIVACGAKPIFADVDAATGCITYFTVRDALTGRTKLVMPVDYAGNIASVRRPRYVYPDSVACTWDERIPVVVDAAQSAGVAAPSGVIRCYSTHAAKNMTTCEGGVAVTDNAELAEHMRWIRNHGVTTAAAERTSHAYDAVALGFNFRMPDPLAALGISQLRRLEAFNRRRAEVAAAYDTAFNGETGVVKRAVTASSNHLYVLTLDLGNLRVDRDAVYGELRRRGVGVNVHFKPVYLHSYYQGLGYQQGLCPNAEWLYARILSLPLYPSLSDADVAYVIDTVKAVLRENAA